MSNQFWAESTLERKVFRKYHKFGNAAIYSFVSVHLSQYFNYKKRSPQEN